ncbi:MAG: type II toxin-antitoxin system VapB family antitoxin, partial [Rhodospirillales bacterium]
MRTTVTIGDDLLAKARESTGITTTPDRVRAGNGALIRREVARRPLALQGTMPDLE